MQRAIAEFLDRETAQIDEMIAAQENLVDRLEERSRAMFAHEAQARVNCGQRLKWSMRESDTRAGDLADALPLLSVSIDWGVRRRDATVNQSASEDLTNYKVVRRGDVVVNRMRAFQGALGRAPEDGIVSPDYSVFRCSPSVDSEWLVVLMRSSPFVSEMANRIRGIGSPEAGQVRTPRINAVDLLDIRIEIPDLDLQRTEVASWRRRAEEMSRMIDAANDSIALMQERRAALISAAVTGRVDPRTGQESTPEQVLEPA
jgi:type I restriction enzyme S subunit